MISSPAFCTTATLRILLMKSFMKMTNFSANISLKFYSYGVRFLYFSMRFNIAYSFTYWLLRLTGVGLTRIGGIIFNRYAINSELNSFINGMLDDFCYSRIYFKLLTKSYPSLMLFLTSVYNLLNDSSMDFYLSYLSGTFGRLLLAYIFRLKNTLISCSISSRLSGIFNSNFFLLH